MKKSTVACGLLLLLAAPAWAQEKPEAQETGKEETRNETEARAEAARQRILERVRRAARLPGTAEEAREAGVPEEEVKEVLEKGRSAKIPASEMQVVLEEETRAAEEHGTIDNFGAFVKQKLDEGLRGRELAAAIRSEHAARGKGPKRDKARKPGKGKGRGKAGHERGHDEEGDDHEERDDLDRHEAHEGRDDDGRPRSTRDARREELEERAARARDDARARVGAGGTGSDEADAEGMTDAARDAARRKKSGKPRPKREDD